MECRSGVTLFISTREYQVTTTIRNIITTYGQIVQGLLEWRVEKHYHLLSKVTEHTQLEAGPWRTHGA